MVRRADEDVTFEGATGPLRGRVDGNEEKPWGAMVLAHGRSETMDGELVAALAGRGAEHGLWTLRFNFAFVGSQSEPSAGHADEIADLREAITYARKASATDIVYLVGRGLGAWASVAAATDEIAAGAFLLGLSYTGQEARRAALERLAEFEIPTLILVGSESDRVDLPALEALVAGLPTLNVDILPRADHRLHDPRGRPMTDAVLQKADAWLHLRREERT